MVCAVKFETFVAFNIVKANKPSPFVVSLVILIVGGHNSTTGFPAGAVPVYTPPHRLFMVPEPSILPELSMVPELLIV